ncbi:alpha/beta hydrolase [Gleimia coleocanis]|nr:alpha/beta hydrolase [Gleimia coleocanis]
MSKHVPLVCVGGLAVHTCDWQQFRRVFERTQPQRPFFVVERSMFDDCVFEVIPAYMWEAELAHLYAHVSKIVSVHGPVQLLGHSMGGLLAEGFARLYPGLVKHLVLLDTASPERFPTVKHEHVPFRKEVSCLGTSLFSRAVIHSFPVAVSALALARGNSFTQAKNLHNLYSTENAVRYFFAELQQEKVWTAQLVEVSKTHALQVPCLVLAAPGNLSAWLPSQKSWVRAQRILAENLASETKHVPGVANGEPRVFKVIERATHMVMLSQPAALNASTYL